MNIKELLNRDIVCECGRTHRCDIEKLEIKAGAINEIRETVENYNRILLVADKNTFQLCGDKVVSLLGSKIENKHVFDCEGYLVPNEENSATLNALVTDKTDLVLGIGSGVVNDICKYVAFNNKIKSGIIATAPSMDGFASSGAAMILGGMKITVTTRAPSIIVGDTDILKNAPMDMITAGYADIIGKYSSLCDWKLSALINGEHLCPFIYDIVKTATDEVRSLAKDVVKRQPNAIEKLMETLVASGLTFTLNGNTRPGSGSEHHLSHFFEITGLIENKPYFLHGTDVGYSTALVAKMRERIRDIENPVFYKISEADKVACYKKIYHGYYSEVKTIQDKFGFYDKDLTETYKGNWQKIRDILSECPTEKEINSMLLEVGFDLSVFENLYGAEKINHATFFGKDLKDRYSFLWIYFGLFINDGEIKKILER